jgi:hypothetical protein
MKPWALFFLFPFSFSLAFAQEDSPAQPSALLVGVKILRPGVIGTARMPPVGGIRVTYGYSLEEPVAGQRLQGLSALYEYTLFPRLSLLLTTTEPLVRGGQAAFGDTCPGFKIQFDHEGRRRPLVAVSYSLKVPTAGTGFGTGLYDHKVNVQADKDLGRTRWTGNFATTWAAQKNGTRLRQYMPAVSALTRWHGRWGSVLQAFWTTSGKGYGGFVAAPFMQVSSTFNVFAGGMRNVGLCTTRYGVIAGVNYLHRPRG